MLQRDVRDETFQRQQFSCCREDSLTALSHPFFPSSGSVDSIRQLKRFTRLKRGLHRLVNELPFIRMNQLPESHFAIAHQVLWWIPDQIVATFADEFHR